MAYILTSDGLGKNSMSFELGRGGYFPSGSGTSETQLMLIKGACEAYKATGTTTYLEAAKNYASCFIKYYCFDTEPPTEGIWPTHWIVNAGEPFFVKGPITNNPNNSGNILSTIPFVGGEATITDLANVYLVATTGSKVTWNCVKATLASGTQKTLSYYFDKYGNKFDINGNFLNVTDLASAGKVKLGGGDASFTGNAAVSYSVYTNTIVLYGTNFECWPMWRVLGTDEWNTASDSIHWAIDAFHSLAELDSAQSTRWVLARDAMLRNWDAVTTISSDLYVSKKEVGKPYDAWPLTYFSVTIAGTEYYSPTEHLTAARDGSGYVVLAIPPNAARSKVTWKNDTLFVTSPTVSADFKIKLHIGTTHLTPARVIIHDADEHVYQCRWEWAAGSSVANAVEIPLNWFGAPYSWGLGTCPGWDEGSGWQFHCTMASTSDGVGFAGSWAAASMPAITYNVTSGDISIRVTDANGATATTALTAGTHTVTPAAPGTAAVYNIDFITTTATAGAIVINTFTGVYNLPSSLDIRKVWVVFEESNPSLYNYIVIGDILFEDIGNSGNLVRQAINYSGGGLPFQLSNNSPHGGSDLGTGSNFQGPFYMGYQNPTPYFIQHVLGNLTAMDKAEVMVNLMGDSQTAYTTSTGVTGPYAPVYLTKAWDSAIFGTVNTFGWSGPDPNTFWGGFQYRAFSNVADFWQRSVLYGVIHSAVTKARTSAVTFLTWLDTWLTNNPAELSVPTAFYEATDPSVPYSDPCMIAVAMKGVLFMKRGGYDAVVCNRVISSLYAMLMKFNATSGDMNGSFTADAVNGVFYGYWAGEIMETLALYSQVM